MESADARYAGVMEACDGALAHDLGWALGVVFRSYIRAVGATVGDMPGGVRGYQVLAAACRGAIANQLTLAQHLRVDRTVMTYLLDDLEASGIIERRPDPADRRARRIVATTKGRRRLVALDKRLKAAEDNILATLSEDERATFRDLLQRLSASMDGVEAGPAEWTEFTGESGDGC
jgi:DNA-binding MarR family transcriptional regulator